MPEMNRSFPQSSGTYESAAAQQERMRQYFASLPPLYPGRHPSKRGKPAHRGRAAPVCRKPHGLFRSLRKGLIHKERRQVPGRNGPMPAGTFLLSDTLEKIKTQSTSPSSKSSSPGSPSINSPMRTRLCSFISSTCRWSSSLTSSLFLIFFNSKEGVV